uniref:Uncharacterized protein n=1 Tax=Anopheles albimanus TaxID=7167 RepID=A0A2C9GGZ5_ANOAL
MKLSLAVLLLSILAVIVFVEAVPAAAPLEDANGTGFCIKFPRICKIIRDIFTPADEPLEPYLEPGFE